MSSKLKQFFLKYTVARIWNLIATEIQYKLKSSYLHSFPVAITIEPGNFCNLQCPLCPTGQRDKSANHGFIKFDDFKRIVDEIGHYVLLIRLYNWGEPLLNKNFNKMVEYATARGIDVKISTNLSMKLTEGEVESLARTSLRKIYISANGASNETYTKYHVGGSFETVMKNMKLLLKKAREANNRYTKYIWLFHVFSHNEHEIEKAKQMAKEIGIKLNVNKMRTDMGKEVFETPEDAIKRDSQWLPENPEYNIFNVEKNTVRRDFRCNLLWKESVINWEGSIMPCCFIYSEKFAFGNFTKKGFKEVWNNKNYVIARKAVSNKNEVHAPQPDSNEFKEKGCTVCHVCKSKGFPFNQ